MDEAEAKFFAVASEPAGSSDGEIRRPQKFRRLNREEEQRYVGVRNPTDIESTDPVIACLLDKENYQRAWPSVLRFSWCRPPQHAKLDNKQEQFEIADVADESVVIFYLFFKCPLFRLDSKIAHKLFKEEKWKIKLVSLDR